MTCSPGSPTRPSRTDRLPTSWMSCGSPPSSSRPARRPRRVSFQRAPADRREPRHPATPPRQAGPHPQLRRGSAAHGESREERLPHGSPDDDARRRRRGGRHHCDDAQRGSQPRSPSLRVPARVPGHHANARQHIAFGHGIHTCPGAPLARAETRISLERIFDRMADIRISEPEHGPAGPRHYDYEPTYILRGLSNLHLEFTPIDDAPEAVGATTVSDFDDDRLLPRRVPRRRPVPLLRVPARRVPGAAGAAPRRGDGDRLRRGDRGVPRHRDVLVVQLGDRTVPRVPGAARGRRRHRAHRAAPRRAADQRPAADVRSAEAHRPPRAADAADHAEAPQGERGVHVAARRSSDRRVPRPRASASSSASTPTRSPCSSSPICSACPRPTTRVPSGAGRRPRGAVGSTGDDTMAHKPLEYLYERFTAYIEDRRREPARRRADRPGDRDVPGRLDARGHRRRPGRRQPLRGRAGDDGPAARRRAPAHRRATPSCSSCSATSATAIPNFVEETLRIESPIKGDFRLSRVPTTVGGVDIPAGTTVMVLNGAANRDPRQFERPGRVPSSTAPTRAQHIAFGHGIHSCPGAPLARAEGGSASSACSTARRDIRISETAHGPAGARRYRYLPTFILRGLSRLHLEFTSVA